MREIQLDGKKEKSGHYFHFGGKMRGITNTIKIVFKRREILHGDRIKFPYKDRSGAGIQV